MLADEFAEILVELLVVFDKQVLEIHLVCKQFLHKVCLPCLSLVFTLEAQCFILRFLVVSVRED
jgi:hypothetical protein